MVGFSDLRECKFLEFDKIILSLTDRATPERKCFCSYERWIGGEDKQFAFKLIYIAVLGAPVSCLSLCESLLRQTEIGDE